MYELVLVYDNGLEEVIYVSDMLLDVELRLQMRARAIGQGLAEIRETKK